MFQDRRTLLKLMAAASMAGCAGQSGERLRVVVAGAGIIGASVAYHLALRGVEVTVIDAAGPATHASRGTFAWINATWAKQPRYYHALNQDGLAGWHSLEPVLGPLVRWGGSLEWFSSPERSARLAAQIEEQVAWGEPAEMVSATRAAELEPRLEWQGEEQVALSPNDGAVDPVAATQALLTAAAARGASVVHPVRLTGVRLRGGRLTHVNTDRGSLQADRLVLATGAATDAPSRFAGIDIPQRTTPGFIVVTEPLPMQLSRIIAAPGVHMHQRTDGRIVLGEQEGAPGTHEERLSCRPLHYPDRALAEQHARPLLAHAGELLPGLEKAAIEDVFIGWRPLPIDGHPVLGPSIARPDVYLAIAHSGVTLAPVLGALAAAEITEGQARPGLEAYRPERAFETVRRY